MAKLGNPNMSSPWEIDAMQMSLRLLLAVVLGGMIGLEREHSNHAAGFRTHILVCVGSCLIMLLSIYGFSDFVNEPQVRVDPARLAAQVISGIGFLGAGAIIRNGLSVSGLTTAASLWVVAGIGLSTGAGFYYAAAISSVLVFIILRLLNVFEKRWFRDKRHHVIRIFVDKQMSSLMFITSYLSDSGIEIQKMVITETDQDEQKRCEPNSRYCLALTVKLPKPLVISSVTEEINRIVGITNISAEKV